MLFQVVADVIGVESFCWSWALPTSVCVDVAVFMALIMSAMVIPAVREISAFIFPVVIVRVSLLPRVPLTAELEVEVLRVAAVSM
jgi:hypothetical protein